MENLKPDNQHYISLETAITMTTLLRSQYERILAPEFKGRNILPFSETYSRSAFDNLLAQPGCEAVRIYYSMNEAIQLRTIFVGVNEKDEDLLSSENNAEAVIVEQCKVCPPICAPSSSLNK